jgi:hypothetical protein
MSGHVRSLASSCEKNFLQRKRSSASGAPSTTVRSLRELQWSPSPASRGRKGPALSQRDLRRSFIQGEARIERISLPYPPLATCFCLPSKKKGEAERRQTQGTTAASYGCGARSCGARTPDGVPPRLSPKGIIPSQRLSFRPGFLGRGLNGRYPPSPVPVQGCTSHPGHNAGRHDAQAARERTANPPASTAPAPPHGLPPVGVLQVSRMV